MEGIRYSEEFIELMLSAKIWHYFSLVFFLYAENYKIWGLLLILCMLLYSLLVLLFKDVPNSRSILKYSNLIWDETHLRTMYLYILGQFWDGHFTTSILERLQFYTIYIQHLIVRLILKSFINSIFVVIKW